MTDKTSDSWITYGYLKDLMSLTDGGWDPVEKKVKQTLDALEYSDSDKIVRDQVRKLFSSEEWKGALKSDWWWTNEPWNDGPAGTATSWLITRVLPDSDGNLEPIEETAHSLFATWGFTELDWIPKSTVKSVFAALGWPSALQMAWENYWSSEPWSSSGLPDWIYNLEDLAKNPMSWLRGNLSKFIIGGAVGVASTTADTVYGSWQAVADAFTYVWSNSLVYGLGSVTGALQMTVDSINQGIVDASASAGAFEPFVFVALWVAVFVAAAYVVRLAIPVLLDLLGMVVGLP